MNANLDKAGRLRGQAQGNGNLLKMPSVPMSGQQKPVFKVLEDSAITDAGAKGRKFFEGPISLRRRIR